ncbi:hypothetical protein CMT42_05915 [Elizabethkingia anophelis]|nr:hypothetical protein AL491_18070 [Elizabethkingia anophelis]AVF50485.1 hypothetical protein AL492_02080 [Elizabethkingia anophelis]MDV2462952.1 hypothetical protein [Elizabethkingia anophelis]MDV2465727.1 hypothetical protein [Elizabethkingia anophelis]MDV2493236.1 hypothetical protein [Elizabethkingia anophelis]
MKYNVLRINRCFKGFYFVKNTKNKCKKVLVNSKIRSIFALANAEQKIIKKIRRVAGVVNGAVC